MKIVVLAGGLSAERDVSLSTGTMVCNALRDAGQEAVLVDLFFGVAEPQADISAAFTCEGRLEPYSVKQDAPDLQAIRRMQPPGGMGGIGPNVIELCRAADIVFLAMHGEPGENGMIQAMLDMMEVKYTGAGYFGSALAMDKWVAKQLFERRGISTPEGRLFRRGQADEALSFPLPCIVKPCSGGSSIGVARAFTEEALRAAVAEAFRHEDEILIEQFITGREFTCGVLGDTALPPAEVIPKGEFYDYAHKYQSGLITEICPAQIPAELTEEIQRVSLEAFRCLGLEVYARMDYIYDGERLYCLEANTLPGMTPTSHLPQEAKAAGIGYEELCMRIIELSLAKYRREDE